STGWPLSATTARHAWGRTKRCGLSASSTPPTRPRKPVARSLRDLGLVAVRPGGIYAGRAGLLPADVLPSLPLHVAVREDDVAAAHVAGGGVRIVRVVRDRVAIAARDVLDEAHAIHAERLHAVGPLAGGVGAALNPNGRAIPVIRDPVRVGRR